MFKNAGAFSSFSADDLEKAKEFYGKTLEIGVTEQSEGLELNIAGSSPIFIYPKPNHSPATFTVLNFLVPDIDKAIEDLTVKGVSMEHYDMKDLKTDEKGVLRDTRMDVAWFKDPAGNILSVIQKK